MLLLGLSAVVLSRLMASSPGELDATVSSQLPPCPESPNCIRTSRPYLVPPAELYELARVTLRDMNPAQITESADMLRIEAVFKAFVFSDDLTLVATPGETGSTLHIRSASRMGYSDFGVNAKRVRRFLALLESRL